MITDLRVHRFRVGLPSKPGLRGPGTERQGVFLELFSSDGLSGFGEATPLENRSRETLVSCEKALRALTPASLERAWQSGTLLEHRLEAASSLVAAELPAARAALELACLDLAARFERLALPRFLERHGTRGASRPLPTAALIDAPATYQAVEQLRSAASQGILHFKVKVGEGGAASSLGRILALAREAPSRARFRLDPNRTLTVIELRELLGGLRGIEIEFLEEPVPAQERAALSGLGVPIALDETLEETPESELDFAAWSLFGASYAVLKPMTHAGISPSSRIAEKARASGYRAIASHLFDGPVAMAGARALALSWGDSETAHGLGVHAVLAAWPGALPVHITSPAIELWDAPGLGITRDALEPSFE